VLDDPPIHIVTPIITVAHSYETTMSGSSEVANPQWRIPMRFDARPVRSGPTTTMASLHSGTMSKASKRRLGGNSPVAFEAVLSRETALKKRSLSAPYIEVEKLVVSQTTGCDYCLAAHTRMGKKIGLNREAIFRVAPRPAVGRCAGRCTPGGNFRCEVNRATA
jgi:AhpD family alkylhydroperoxidase